MSPSLSLRALVLTGSLLPLVACTTTAPVPEPEEAIPQGEIVTDDLRIEQAPEEALSSDQAKAEFHVMAGEMAAGRGQSQLAAEQFVEALKWVEDPELAKRATGYAVAAGDDELALDGARRWLALQPDEAEPREVIATVLLNRGELAGTLEQCREIVRRHPGGIGDGFRHAAQLLAQGSPDVADLAMSIMSQLVSEWPDQAGAYGAQSILAVRYGQLELAESAANKALELAPDEREHALLLIGIWVRQDRLDEADARMRKLTAKGADAAELRMAYGRLLLDAGHRDAARREFEAASKLKSDYPEARFALGVLATADGDYAAAERYLLPLLKGPRSEEAALQLGRAAEAQQHFPQALDYYSRVVHGPAALDAAVRRASVLADMGRMDEARTLLGQLRDSFPQFGMRFLMAEGELLINHNELDAAQQLYDDALAEDPDNLDLLYGRSLVYERMAKIDLAEADLRRILNEAPDDARALNALGYMLVVHTDRFNEARMLITQALALSPEDAAITDSMGWLHFRQGDPQAALPWLQKAYADFPDPEVAAHLGEVLWALDQRDEAQRVWDAALQRHPDHPVLRQTVDRLTR